MRVTTIGTDRGRGNLLGVEPWMSVEDYRSADHLESRLDVCLAEARRCGLLSARTIAVFPEYIGTWLVAAGAPERLFRSARTAEAMRVLALRRPVGFLARLASSRAQDRATESIFRLKAGRAAAAYQRVFSGLARRYRLAIVAGSILLPAPQVQDGVLRPGRGPLSNVAAVFDPEGAIVPSLVRKCHPTADEHRFISSGSPRDLPSFETQAGRLGVLVCADSWYPDCWERMKELGVGMVVVVSFSQGDDSWALPWKGYSGAPAPADVDPSDVGRLTEGQSWRKYALAGRIGSSAARCGVNVFLRGSLWDLGSDGATTLVRDNEVAAAERTSASSEGTLASCWL